MTSPEWVSAAEIARGAGVKPAAVSNWRRRHADFPAAERHGGREVFRVGDVAAWLDGRPVAAPDHRPGEEPGATYGRRFRQAVGATEPVAGPSGAAGVPAGTAGRLWWALADACRGKVGMSDDLMLLTGLAFAFLHLRFHRAQRWTELTAAAADVEPGTVVRLVESALRASGEAPASIADMSALLGDTSDVRRLVPLIQILDRLEPVPDAGSGDVAPPAGRIADELLAHAATVGGWRSANVVTPPSVVRTAVRLTDPVGGDRVHDPFCRAGEFLVGAADHVRSRGTGSLKLTASGQETNPSLRWLARMNLLLHNIGAENLRAGWALSPSPQPGGPFEVVMVNPPFNMSGWRDGDQTSDSRWRYGVPPGHNANYAWLQHTLACLAEGGRAVVVMPAGAGSSANAQESAIRAAMVEDGVVDAVVALPRRLFAHTSIPVTLWVLRRPDPDHDDVLFVDAHEAGRIVERNHSELRDEDVDHIAEAYRNRAARSTRTVLSRPVDRRRIRENGYVLSPARYLTATTEPVDPLRARVGIEQLRRDLRELHQRAAGAHEHAERQLDEVGDLFGAATTGWRRLPLGDVCDVLAGFSGAVRTERGLPSGIPVVKPRNLVDNRISPEGVDYVAPDVAARMERYRLRAGDIVCVRTGQLGRQALVTEEQSGWLIGTSCLRLRPDESVDPRYLVHFLALPQISEWLLGHSTGSAIRVLTAATMRGLPLVLPDRHQQGRIGSAAGSLDDLVAVHDRIRQVSSALRDALLPLFLQDPTPPGPVPEEGSKS